MRGSVVGRGYGAMVFGMEAVVVHGAAGFVASTLIEQLLNDGFDRFVLVDKRPIPDSRCSRLRDAGAETICIESTTIAEISLPWPVKVVFVLAGQTDVDEALEFPARAFRSNLEIAIDVAEWVRLCAPDARVVYLSSDEVLGESFESLDETCHRSPTQPYAASKAAAELVLENYQSTFRTNLVILRSCNLVGGAQRARKLIPVAVQNLLSGQPVPIYGDGSNLREWMAVEDLTSALRLAGAGVLPPGCYHASSGVRMNQLEVVDLVAKAIGCPFIPVYVKDRLVHDRCYSMDNRKLRSFQWTPTNDTRDAVQAAAREMQSAYKAGERLVPER